MQKISPQRWSLFGDERKISSCYSTYFSRLGKKLNLLTVAHRLSFSGKRTHQLISQTSRQLEGKTRNFVTGPTDTCSSGVNSIRVEKLIPMVYRTRKFLKLIALKACWYGKVGTRIFVPSIPSLTLALMKKSNTRMDFSNFNGKENLLSDSVIKRIFVSFVLRLPYW